MRKLLLIIGIALLAGCKRDVNISLDKTQDNGIITFRIDNPTDQDIEYIEIGFNHLDAGGEVIMSDTLYYKMDESMEEKIFLEANGYTWVSQKPVEGAERMEAYIVAYE